jgi:hypothetical protein
LAASLQTFDQQGTVLLAKIRDAGTPAVANGADFVAAMVSQVQAQHAEAATLAERVAAIDVSNGSAFIASFQRVVDLSKRDGDAFRATARANPAFVQAPAALRPIVVFMTTSADTCKKS